MKGHFDRKQFFGDKTVMIKEHAEKDAAVFKSSCRGGTKNKVLSSDKTGDLLKAWHRSELSNVLYQNSKLAAIGFGLLPFDQNVYLENKV